MEKRSADNSETESREPVSQDPALGCQTARQSGIDPRDLDGWEQAALVVGATLSGLANSEEDDACAHGAAVAQTIHDVRAAIKKKDDNSNENSVDNSNNVDHGGVDETRDRAPWGTKWDRGNNHESTIDESGDRSPWGSTWD